MNFWISLFVILVWHFVVFIYITRRGYKFFYRNNKIKDIKVFQKREKFYENIFKIKFWKDKIPQYIGKNGFSKKNFKSFNFSYLKEFIAETYRGEIYHAECCMIIPLLFFASSLNIAICLSIFIIFINLPCIFIQRYNRARLRKLLIKIEKNEFF